jgi:hypothetical protein
MYYQMIKEGDFLFRDPYFGSQITYAYGVPAYALSGLLWSFFGVHSITVIEIIVVLISYVILRKWFKSEKWISVLIMLNLLFTVFDSYVGAVSNCLFWLASYGFYKKVKWWPIPLLIAAFNHPFVLISSLFFAVQMPILIFPLSIIMSYFVIATKVFTTGLYLPVYTIFMGFGRTVVNLVPALVLVGIGKIKLEHFKILSSVSTYRVRIPTLLITLILAFLLLAFLAIYTLVFQPDEVINFSILDDVPLVNGTLRVVDYLYLPSVYLLPAKGFTLQAGSFRENNPQHMMKEYWDNTDEYSSFIQGLNVSYVLHCKMCNPQSNELRMLEDYYDLVWENEYYWMFSVD